MKMKTIQLFILAFCLPLLAFADGGAESYSVKFSPQGWATFNSNKAVTVPDGVDVYIVTVSKDGATGNEDYVATLHLVDLPKEDSQRYIPAIEQEHNGCSNPVVLKYTPSSEIELTVLEADSYNNYEGCLYNSYLSQENGLLIGTGDEGVTADNTGYFHTYVLGHTATSGTAFYEVAPGTIIPANRSYIEISSLDYSNSRIRVEIDDNPTSINSAYTSISTTAHRIYDLFGREITTPQRGQIYIRNNHKFIQE